MTKITDLVDPSAIEQLKTLDRELRSALETYLEVARSMARGLNIDVRGIADLERLEALLAEKSREAAEAQRKLSEVMAQQQTVIANTTNTISRQLMEQERVNKTQREAYTEYDRVKRLLEQYYDTYDEQIKRLGQLDNQLRNNKKAQKDNEKALTEGKVTMEQYLAKQAELTTQYRALATEKRTLDQIMKAEEKANQEQEDSTRRLSLQVDLLKKAWNQLGEEGRNSDFGKELEEVAQNLDAHVKDMGARMGDFHRNVGNYAIACQNGVVTTQSLSDCIQQEANTFKDLADQTKLIEESITMLDRKDANYQKTLDAANAKLAENKRKLSDVSDIMGKEAKTVSEAEAQNKRFAEAIKHISVRTAEGKRQIEAINERIKENKKVIDEATGANEGFAERLLSLVGVNTSFGKSFEGLGKGGNFLDGLRIKTEAFSKTLIGMLANPWVLAFLGIAGTAAAFKWWYDYNKGLIEASRLTENFTGKTGEAADAVTTRMQALGDKMGKSYSDTIGAANQLVQHFGITWDEAMQLMQDGIVAGADMSGNLTDNISQFAGAFKDAGVSAEQFMAILAETRNGLFDEKALQSISVAGNRLRAMTDATEKALNNVGIDAKKMQEDVASGNISMMDAIKMITDKLKELPVNSQEAGEIMKNVFGRAAGQMGSGFLKSISDVNDNLQVAKERMGELGKANDEQMNAQAELSAMTAALFKANGTSFEVMTTKAKTYVAQGLTTIIKGCIDIANWAIRIYNNSAMVRAGLMKTILTFKNLWEVGKMLFNNLINGFKSLGAIIEDIFTGNFSKIKEDYQKGLQSFGDNVANAMKNIAQNAVDAYNEIAEGGNLKEFKLPDTSSAEAPSGNLNKTIDSSDYVAPEDEDEKKKKEEERKKQEQEAKKAAKEREKEMKEELKKLEALEESKIAIMADGHEKDMAQIRLNIKKKLDQITGDGETEKALRVQLIDQMNAELAKCEADFQKKISETNLANRLEYVKKGSNEERILKLAQLRRQEEEELAEADKNGADKNIIAEKYAAKRLEIEKAYNEAQLKEMDDNFANEQDKRNNQMLEELAALRQKYAERLKVAKTAEEREAAEKELNDESEKLQTDYAKRTAQASITYLEAILDSDKLTAEQREAYAKQLAEAKIKLSEATTDEEVANIKKTADEEAAAKAKRLKALNDWAQRAQEVFASITDFVSNMYDAQIDKMDEQIEANTEAGDAEQERIQELVDSNVITEEEGEARKQAAEAETAAKNKKFEEEKAALQMKAAKFKKASDLAQATISTSLAIVTALHSASFPLNLVFAAMAATMGALQIATIAAQPLPKYAKGTDSHPGGLAVVGDGGRQEVVRVGDMTWLTPDKPTLVDLPQGAEVVPSIERFIAENTAASVPTDGINTIVVNDYSELKASNERGFNRIAAMIQAQIKAQRKADYKARYELYKQSKL